MDKKQKMNKKSKGEERVGEGERERGKGGEGRKQDASLVCLPNLFILLFNFL